MIQQGAQAATDWLHSGKTPNIEAMKSHFQEDYVGHFLATHPEFIKVLFDKLQQHRDITTAEYKAKYGKFIKERIWLDEQKEKYAANPQAKATINGKEQSIITALAEYERGLDQEEQLAKREVGPDGHHLLASDKMDLDSQHFFTLLLASLTEVHQHNHDVMFDHDGGHYLPHEQSTGHPPGCTCGFCQNPGKITPLGVSQPQFNTQGQHVGTDFKPGYYYGQEGYPPAPPAGVQPHHGPSGATGIALGLLSKVATL